MLQRLRLEMRIHVIVTSVKDIWALTSCDAKLVRPKAKAKKYNGNFPSEFIFL